MKMVKIAYPEKEAFKSQYSVQDISSEDLGTPSRRFFEMTKKIKSLKGVKASNIDLFKKEIEMQFKR